MKILLVEDHEDTRTAMERLLVRWGHQVEAAASVQAGKDALRAQAFDTILSDIALRDGSGYALMNFARHLGHRGLAIAISAYRFPEAIAEPGVTGFNFYLNKPLDAARLRRLLDETPAETVEVAG